MSQHSKECCNKVEELEEENYVATKENYVAAKEKDERIEDCHDKEIYVATEFKVAENDKVCCYKVFMLRHKLDNFSKTLSRHKNIMSRKTPRRNYKNHIAKEKLQTTTRAGTEMKIYVATEFIFFTKKRLIGPEFLGIHNLCLEVRPIT